MSGRSLLDLAIERTVRDTLEKQFASREFKSWLSLRIKWSMQGFEPGFDLKQREAFTHTVAARIRRRAREPVYLWGHRIWRKRMPWDECAKEAERIVTDFLRDERIKFGDRAFYWGEGIDLADEDMSNWETCP